MARNFTRKTGYNTIDKDKWRTDINYKFKDYEEIEWQDLKKGDIIKYFGKAYNWKGKETKEGWRGGGFVSIVEKEFVGIKSTYGDGQFTAQRKNILKLIRRIKKQDEDTETESD